VHVPNFVVITSIALLSHQVFPIEHVPGQLFIVDKLDMAVYYE